MPTLHLGVVDIPYVNAPAKRQRKATSSTVTTGQVAEWLEDKYNVMEHFVDRHGGYIGQVLVDSLEGAMESMAMGAPIDHDIYGSATSKIEERFRRFISQAEMDSMGVLGVPTQAALDRAEGRRRSARMNRRRATIKPVSFYDTGLYMGSFRAWVD